MECKIEIGEKCLFFLTGNTRYKVAYGGRGGYKSWSVARSLIAKSIEKKIRILCTREIQNSIKDSVHRLISDQIHLMGLQGSFTITNDSITNVLGSQFIFKGLRANTAEIKSLEGIDINWTEEAESVKSDSWDVLIPTIRKPGSEIWVTFNTGHEDDDTYRRFVTNKPENCETVQTFYYENPWLPDVLAKEARDCKARDPIKYRSIWLGEPIGTGGKIWTPYDENIHVRDFPMEQVAKTANCFMGMDPHSKYFPFCVWVALIPKTGRTTEWEDFYKWIYAEWPTYDMFSGYYSEYRNKNFLSNWGTIADFAREVYIKDGLQEHGINVFSRYIDTRFAKGSGGENWSSDTLGIIETFSDPKNGGLKFEKPYEKIIDAQRNRILEDMQYNTLCERNAFNEPDFYVAPWCRNVRQSLKYHRCEDDSEKESEKYKDPSDAIRITYAGLSEFRYRDPARFARGGALRRIESAEEYAGVGTSESWMG
jgi:hypothetical protein